MSPELITRFCIDTVFNFIWELTSSPPRTKPEADTGVK